MTDTHWHTNQYDDPSSISRVHTVVENQLAALPPYALITFADGGLRSSANDLALYLAAISNGGALNDVRILTDQKVSQMIASQTEGIDMGDMAATMDYYGTFWSGMAGLVGHDGGDPGITTTMYFDPQRKMGFVILINLDSDAIPNLQDILVSTIRFAFALKYADKK